jgi:arsenite-transporting ATPase
MNAPSDSSLIPHPSSLVQTFDSLSERRVLLFGGKGGVGKTTISTAAALHYSATRKTILFTTDPASNLGDLFDNSTTRQPDNLLIEALRAEEWYSKFLDENLAQFLELGDRGTYLDKEELRRFFELSLPGVDELMAWMRIGELVEQNAEAMVIVDTAPTGHTLRMLGAAEHFRQFAAALESMQAKHRQIVRQLTRRNVRDEIDAFIDDFEERARRRRELLTDSAKAGFIPVFLSEEWVVEQTKRLIGEVRSDGIDVPLAILNRAAHDCDCDRCRAQQKRDRAARTSVDVMVIDAPRACVPLDSAGRIAAWLRGEQRAASSERVHRFVPARRSPLAARRLIFLAGKGGVGKTTCAASIGLQLAGRNANKRYTALSVDPAHTLRDVFDRQRPPENLTIETIDTRERWRRFRETLGQEIDHAVAALTPSGVTLEYDAEAMRNLVEIAPPGADELFAISRLADLIADRAQDAIIVDTAPTGHFLRLLDLPRTAGEWVREFMRILLRYRELIPAGSLGEELVHASRSLHALEETLHSADCGVVVVTRPERIVVAETRRLIDELKRRGINVSGVIANYVTPETDCSCDRSMRAHENAALQELGREAVVIERRDAPVTSLAELAALVPLDSRS